MPRVYIGVGSNIDPERNIPAALKMLGEAVRIVAISTFYKTSPIGSPNSPEFYNGVVAIDTDVLPRDLKFRVLRRIEEAVGRIRCDDKYAPRTIDLDILLYGDIIINEPDLIIPDPDIATREFLAVPLMEICPDMALPHLSTDSMTALNQFTHELRLEIGYES